MELYTIKEAAAILKVSTKTVYRLIQSMKLENVKVGSQTRITLQGLQQYISTNTKGACNA